MNTLLTLVTAVLFSTSPGTTQKPAPARAVKVHKAERRMTYEEHGEIVRTFRIGLGGDPSGDKVKRGDSRTPEGELYVTYKKERSDFHRFIGLSYPMPRHAALGVEAGLIDEDTAVAIQRAARRKKVTPQGTRLGGYVGIHGGGGDYDWTLGCIAVTDEEAEWLFERLRPGDPITIYP